MSLSSSGSGSSSGFYGRRNTRSGRRLPLASINDHMAVRYPRADGAGRETETTHYSPGDLLQDRQGVSLGESDDGYDGYDGVGDDQQLTFPPLGLTNDTFTTPSRLHYHRDESAETQRRHTEPVASNRAERNASICAMLQQQQALLQRLIECQEALKDKHSAFEAKLVEIEQKCLSSCTPLSSQSSDDTSRKRKHTITRELSNKVTKVHTSLDDGFNPEESSTSEHNGNVKEMIKENILQQPNCKYSEDTVTAAIKRCYQNIRRTFTENQMGKENYVENQAKRRKYRSRRQRMFDKRGAVVTEREMKFWSAISPAYMTEESDNPDDPNSLIMHKLQWRSDKLNKFIEVLDKRVERTTKETPGLVAKKERKEGELSSSLPPNGAPKWAIKQVPRSGSDTEIDITNETQSDIDDHVF